MPHRLEIALKPGLFDAEGEGVRQKAKNYFGFQIDEVRTVNIIIIDADLSSAQLKSVQNEIFTNPVIAPTFTSSTAKPSHSLSLPPPCHR